MYSFVIIFSYAIFEMVWTEKVHTFLFCLWIASFLAMTGEAERGNEIMVVKSPLCVQKAAKRKKQNSISGPQAATGHRHSERSEGIQKEELDCFGKPRNDGVLQLYIWCVYAGK